MAGDSYRRVIPARDEHRLAFDTTVAHAARVCDYRLVGKDNFAVDRAPAEQAIEAFPGAIRGVRANRALPGRAVRYPAATMLGLLARP